MQKCPQLFLRVVHCEGRPRAASSGCAVKVHLQVSSRYDISHRNSPSWSSGGALWRQATRQPPASSSGCAMKVHLQLSSRCVMSHRNAPSCSSGWCIVKADLRPAPSFFLRMCDEGVPPVIFQVCHVTQKCSQSFLRVVHCDDMPHASPQPLLVGVPWRCTSSLPSTRCVISHSITPGCASQWCVVKAGFTPASSSGCAMKVHLQVIF